MAGYHMGLNTRHVTVRLDQGSNSLGSRLSLGSGAELQLLAWPRSQFPGAEAQIGIGTEGTWLLYRLGHNFSTGLKCRLSEGQGIV